MRKQEKSQRLNKKGFSLVELTVIIAILVVFCAVLAPAVLRYVENSRMQKDESAMDEVCGAIKLAIADSETFDEVCAYAVPGNYITYSDSSGAYASIYTDEEHWAPDGAGYAVTITFNPDENGNYDIASARVNDMTTDNGSVADDRTIDSSYQCALSEMGSQKLYLALKQTLGETLSDKSATYKNSSYTVFIKLNVVDTVKHADVYGSFNGTNLSPECPAAIGSGTSEYTPEGEAIITKPEGGTQAPNFSNSDLSGSGGGGVSGNNPNPTPETPSEPEEDVVEEKCNLYFGEKYSAIVDGTKITAVFYEDTSAKMYMNNVLEQEFPVGLIKYDASTVDLSAINFGIGAISADGKKINVDGIMLVLEEAKLHFGVPYTNMDAGYAISLVAYEDGRAEIWAYRFWKQDSYPAGTFTYEENKVITEGMTIATVSSDGMQVEYEGMTFDLDTSWCPHGNTYTVGATEKYTGDTYCADCKELINEGQCKHVNTKQQNVKDATCTENGYTGDIICLDCQKITTRGTTIAMLKHIDSDNNGHCDICGADYYSAGTIVFNSDGQASLYGENASVSATYTGWNTSVYTSATRVPWNSKRASIKNVIIKDGINIASTDYWFTNCTNLTNVTLSDNIPFLGEQMFYRCTNLSSVVLPQGITKVGNFAFGSCSSLKSIIIPNSVTTIISNAFSDCTSLQQITIGENVTSIGVRAFYNCKSLTSIVIPESVTRIGQQSILNCTNLTSVRFMDTNGWYLLTTNTEDIRIDVDALDNIVTINYLKDSYKWYKS